MKIGSNGQYDFKPGPGRTSFAPAFYLLLITRKYSIEEKMPFNSPPNRLDDVQAFIELKLWHLLCWHRMPERKRFKLQTEKRAHDLDLKYQSLRSPRIQERLRPQLVLSPTWQWHFMKPFWFFQPHLPQSILLPHHELICLARGSPLRGCVSTGGFMSRKQIKNRVMRLYKKRGG